MGQPGARTADGGAGRMSSANATEALRSGRIDREYSEASTSGVAGEELYDGEVIAASRPVPRRKEDVLDVLSCVGRHLQDQGRRIIGIGRTALETARRSDHAVTRCPEPTAPARRPSSPRHCRSRGVAGARRSARPCVRDGARHAGDYLQQISENPSGRWRARPRAVSVAISCERPRAVLHHDDVRPAGDRATWKGNGRRWSRGRTPTLGTPPSRI